MNTPETNIYICAGVMLNHDYAHTIWFNSKSEQKAYFSGKVVKTFLDYTTVRKSWSIQVPATMEEAISWSYLYFTNFDSGKTFYYFINDVEYISDDCTELKLEMDVMQTYLFDYALLPCFVEREHASTDNIGDNLIEENLELGEFVVNSSQNIAMQEYDILTLANFDMGFRKDNEPSLMNHVPFMVDGVFLPDFYINATHTEDHKVLRNCLQLANVDGRTDGIVSVWMYPRKLLTYADRGDYEEEANFKAIKLVQGGKTFDTLFTRPMSVNGWNPRNKKLLTYPYNFLYVTNNVGGSATFRYEYFGDPSAVVFRTTGTPSPDASTKLFPVNYKGIVLNYEEGLTGASFPTCAWNSDVYKLWLAQNQNQESVSGIMSGLSIVGGAVMLATGAGAMVGGGMIAGGVAGIASAIARKQDLKTQPPQSKGHHSANLNVANEFNTFTVQRKSISKEFAEIIDDFFDMFGYACHKVKTPNRNVRKAWTYCKTQNCHISASLGAEDQIKIQNIYNNGITFWKDGDEIGNYSQDNTI